MRVVKLDDIDKIGEIAIELEMLTYLQGLILTDADEEPFCKDLASARKDAESFLWDRQLDAILDLKKLLLKDDFASCAITTNADTKTSL